MPGDELAAKPELASLVQGLPAMRASIVERIEELDARLRARAKAAPVCRRFMTVPDVGPITALAVSASIDDRERLVRARDVGACFGLTPSMVSRPSIRSAKRTPAAAGGGSLRLG